MANDDTVPSVKTKFYWVALAFGPSSLMLGLTSFITTDIASMPLFWVIPLALYLITFIFAFSKHQERITHYAIHAQNILVPMTVFVMIFEIHFLYAFVLLHLLTFFITAMVCHGTLSGVKPRNTKYLTEYFVWVSFGGMLGGIFNSLIAPNIFTNPIEYFVMFVGCLLLRPTVGSYANLKRERILDIAIPALFCVGLLLTFHLISIFLVDISSALRSAIIEGKQELSAGTKLAISNTKFVIIILIYIGIMMVIDKTYQRPLRFTLVIMGIFSIILIPKLMNERDNYLYSERNFFGVTRVIDYEDVVLMMHGTTTHGVQSKDPKMKLALTSYYTPLKAVYSAISSNLRGHPYALIGLGAGTSACVGKKGDAVDIYEIDPAVVKMSSNPKFFTYLQDCPTKHTIILGDGRLSIAKAPDKQYSLIIVDAFTSDAIPMHLLTREALAMYKSKLGDNGILAFNISNRYMDLSVLLANLAVGLDMHAITLQYDGEGEEELAYSSSWVILTQDSGYHERLASHINNNKLASIEKLQGNPKGLTWTDDYSNILKLLY